MNKIAGAIAACAAMVVALSSDAQAALYPVHGLAVMSSKHRLSRNKVIEVSELSDEPLVLLCQEFPMADLS